jgi:hypothetical protein
MKMVVPVTISSQRMQLIQHDEKNPVQIFEVQVAEQVEFHRVICRGVYLGNEMVAKNLILNNLSMNEDNRKSVGNLPLFFP